VSGIHRRWLAPVLAATLWLWLGCGGGDDATGPGVTERMEPREQSLVREDAADPANLAPVIESVTLEPSDPSAGDPVVARVEATDTEGDRLRYSYTWRLDGERLPGSGPRVELPRSERGDEIELVVVASDGNSESEPYHVSTWVVNRPPRLLGIQIEPADHITAGTEISVTPSADDPDGDPLTFRYRWTVNGRRTGGSGPELETEHLRRGDAIQVWAVANDGEADSEPIQSPAINVANAPPRIISVPGGTGSDGEFRYEVEAEDPDNDRSLRYRIEDAPEGMKIEVLSGLITWRPTDSQAGTHTVQVIVDDLQGGIGRQAFEVSVGIDNAAPPAAPEPSDAGAASSDEE